MSVTPPRPRGPHLNAMRSFEAAARLGGFAAAAEELCVTPGAVSQQVRALEEWVGAPLFERRTQGVRLTALGAEVRPGFEAAFDALGDALHGLRAAAPGGPVSIAALPSVAQLWLAPRLADVRARMPAQTISITALETPPNMQREVFDLALFFGRPGEMPNSRVLAVDRTFPVCAPQVAARLNTPQDLAGVELIHDATWRDDWNTWLAAAGLPTEMANHGAVHSLYAIAVAEAIGGAGVLIGHEPLVTEHLAEGKLVRPFPLEIDTGQGLLLGAASSLPSGSAAACVAELMCKPRGETSTNP